MTLTLSCLENKQAAGGLAVAQSAAVLILAHDEAGVIETTVQSIALAQNPEDILYVVADNCSDDTAKLAAAAGACVLERRSRSPDGKGAALKWFAIQHSDLLERHDLVVILDADNLVAPDFLRDVKAAYPGDGVMQCLVQPVGYHGSPLSTLIALSEIHEQKTVDAIRVSFGWPVRLRGTGMVMPPRILKIVAGMIDTEVEDIAMSLLFTARGIPVQRNTRICVQDPKPRESVLASRQRARWFRGQWNAFWLYRREVGTLIKRGPAGWSLLSNLFLKPRWLADMILLLLALAALQVSWLLAAPLLAKALFDLVCLIWTIFASENRNEYLKAILHIPGFILMWMRGFLLAFQKSIWLRARE
jgi:cellulose synthase/poly-beta-1,6-N-acetylglucosamine synthase-like glycosyltransferase